ncbi:Vacuolar protein sorting-associated protein [Wickerhamomyces ciferrii]|uniref:Vacuolar protein sorting-associated protein n=1 Tax=Wickerhamomyces ciferrii (strain ATCC 14091 / BCRC 22168 / CBS 111 / JCM 3599 / NBRC 0793 / NRRL Y-1031 F-60-10) TaxID=1206466 RepID=K0K9F7_WICCF|nr:Vacuolar protein sorting-associated protein [Wickerhamomyces ciferrii]CCH41545.1 Vacuolar protein sorting-associated protein [Wickerhamomyces ciferrii]
MSDDQSIDIDSSSIFSVAPVQFQTEISNISSLNVSSDILTIGFKSGKVFRIDLNNPAHIDSVELPYKRSVSELGQLVKLFQDPTGNHVLVTTSRNENFYIHKKSSTFRYLNELKNVKISAIGWNAQAVTESNTGCFLIGDKTGVVYEAFLEYHDMVQKYYKKISKTSYNSQSSIDGIQIDFDQETNELMILIVSGEDIAYWNQPIRHKHAKYNDLILGSYIKAKPIESEKYQDLGNINGEKFSARESSFGWLTSAGTVFGNIDKSLMSSKKNFAELKFLVNLELPESKHKFKSIALTKYHLILLRGQELLAINKLNDELVFHQILPVSEGERFIGISADYVTSTYWVYSNLNIYEITVTDEEKDIWRAMIENENYDDALNVTTDEEIKDIIYSKQGDYFFENKLYKKAALIYALSSQPFETVALKFIEEQENDGLLDYFLSKLSVLKSNTKFDFHMQQVMLSSWIVELFIEKLNEIDDSLTTEQSAEIQSTTALKTQTEKTLQEFLIDNKNILDKATIYEIITSHNRRAELLYYANLINDFDFVLAYWIRLENWPEALKILERNNDVDAVYKYSTVLLVNSPEKTVESWLRISGIDASKLLPAILAYHKNFKKVDVAKNHVIRYLKTFIGEKKCKDSIIHDSLLYILISNESTSGNDEDVILRYLEEYSNSVYYNSDFILRLCLKFKKIKSAVYVYSVLEYYEDAVDLALKNDMIDLSMVIADKASDDKTRKFLWLKISEKKISYIRPSEKDKIKNEVKFLLERCEILTIKDLLPKIPDFTTIDNLKDEICADLEKFGTLINKLSIDMNSSGAINENITKEIETYKNKSQVIKSGESCSICEFLLTSRKFFIFPCNHAFHSDCLIKEISKSNDYSTKKKLEFLQKKFLASRNDNQKPGSKFINSPDVDALLCKRCPLCSDLKIDTIDDPFLDNSIKADEWDV